MNTCTCIRRSTGRNSSSTHLSAYSYVPTRIFVFLYFFFANLLHEKTPTTEGPAEVTAAAAEAASGSERKQHHQQQQAAAATAASAAASTAVAADEAEDAKAEPTSELPLYLWVDIPHISASSRSYVPSVITEDLLQGF